MSFWVFDLTSAHRNRITYDSVYYYYYYCYFDVMTVRRRVGGGNTHARMIIIVIVTRRRAWTWPRRQPVATLTAGRHATWPPGSAVRVCAAANLRAVAAPRRLKAYRRRSSSPPDRSTDRCIARVPPSRRVCREFCTLCTILFCYSTKRVSRRKLQIPIYRNVNNIILTTRVRHRFVHMSPPVSRHTRCTL